MGKLKQKRWNYFVIFQLRDRIDGVMVKVLVSIALRLWDGAPV